MYQIGFGVGNDLSIHINSTGLLLDDEQVLLYDATLHNDFKFLFDDATLHKDKKLDWCKKIQDHRAMPNYRIYNIKVDSSL